MKPKLTHGLLEDCQRLANEHGLPSAYAKHMNIDVVREHPRVMARLAGKRVEGLLHQRHGFRPCILVDCYLSKRNGEAVVAHELGHAAGFKNEQECDVLAGAFMSGANRVALVESREEVQMRARIAERRADELDAYDAGRASRASR